MPLYLGDTPRKADALIVATVRATPVLLLMLSVLVSMTPAGEIYEPLGNEAARFLLVYPDPRGQALGQACSATCRGISGVCWNPAGLAFSDGLEFADQGNLVPAVHWNADWASGIEFEFVGAALRIGSMWEHIPLGTIAVWRRQVSFSNITRRLEFGEYLLGDLEQEAFEITYGHILCPGFAIGVSRSWVESHWESTFPATGDYLRRDTEYEGTGWDIGFMYRRTFSLGDRVTLTLNAAFGELNVGKVRISPDRRGSKFRLPQRHFLGVAPCFQFMHGALEIAPAFDLTYKEETLDYSYHAGAEVTLWHLAAVRFGTYSAEDTSDPVSTWGLGLNLQWRNAMRLSYDWAHCSIIPEAGAIDQHMLSINLLRTLRAQHATTHRQ